MQINQRTLQLIKNFSTINPSIQFKKGNVMRTVSPNKTIMASAKVDQEFPVDFAIYDLSKFLSVLSLFKKPNLDFEEKQVRISAGNEKIYFTYADPETIKYATPKKEIKLPHVDVAFTVTPEMLASVSKATSVLGVPDIAIVGEEGKIMLRAFDSDHKTSDFYSFEIGETDKYFKAIFKAEYLKLIPQTYNVQICKTEDTALSQFSGDGINYWIAIELNSTFEE